MHEFPKWKYHAQKPALIVHSKEAEIELGAGWYDNPAHVKAEQSAEALDAVKNKKHLKKAKA